MTAPAEAEASRPPPKRRLLKILFVLSLTLNVFFIGGLVFSKVANLQGQGPAQRFQKLARELTLAPEQRVAFQKMGRVIRLRGQNMREANRELVAQAWDELAKPQPDQQTLGRIFAQVADNRRDYQVEVGDAMRDFLATLTPEQRVQFVDLAKHQQDGLAARIWRILLP